MTDEKSNIDPVETPTTVHQEQGGTRPGRERQQVTEVGRTRKGVQTLSKADGGDGYVPEVEIGTDQNEREADGRRKFH